MKENTNRSSELGSDLDSPRGLAVDVKLKSTTVASHSVTTRYVLKDDELPPVIQTVLADTMVRFRQDWISLSRRYFPFIESINKSPVGGAGNLSKHITATFLNGLSDFGQFLCQFEFFFLENPERLVLLEHGRLSPYECFLKLRDFCRDEMGVSDVRKANQAFLYKANA